MEMSKYKSVDCYPITCSYGPKHFCGHLGWEGGGGGGGRTHIVFQRIFVMQTCGGHFSVGLWLFWEGKKLSRFFFFLEYNDLNDKLIYVKQPGIFSLEGNFSCLVFQIRHLRSLSDSIAMI